MNARKFIFYTLDLLKGAVVRGRVNHLKKYLLKASYSELKADQTKQLQNLINRVNSSVPFYMNLEEFEFDQFPVVNKEIIKLKQSDFLSKNYNSDKLSFQQTSGSTGTPFRVYQNKLKKKMHQADNIFFNELAGLELGGRIYYFRIWDKLVKKSKMSFFFQNAVPMDSSKLDCSSLQQTFFKPLETEKQKVVLLAYSSTFEAISCCLEGKKSIGNVMSVITMSETLPFKSKLKLENAFQCKVYSRYSNMENGFIAQHNPFNDKYLINEASYVVECLDFESDQSVPLGQMGRIVVTDLFNDAMPLIRYDTGDVGSLSKEMVNGVERLFINRIEGRRVDFIFDENDSIVSPHIITNTMWRYNSIKQFQFVQKNRAEYEMRLNGVPFSKEIEEQLKEEIKNHLGQSISLSFKYVDEIPLLNSGKRKKIVNEYKLL